MHDPLDGILETRGIFTSFDPPYNARRALTYWEAHPETTILTNGCAYMVYRDAVATAPGWTQVSPEEMEARLDA